MVVEILLRFWGNPNSKSHRATVPYIMIEKKFLTDTHFRKEKGRHDKNIKRFASGNVIIVYTTSLLFDVIDRLCPKKRQKSKSCSANR